jgi:hypothetical protein
MAGIEFTLPPKGPMDDDADRKDWGPRPGWYAVSVTILRGYHYPIPNGSGGLSPVNGPAYAYFLRFHPVARAGYSIYVYHLTEDDCNCVRRDLGFPRVGANPVTP